MSQFALQPGEVMSGIIVRHPCTSFFSVVDGDKELEVWLPKHSHLLLSDALTPESVEPVHQQSARITAVRLIEENEEGMLYHLEPC